MRLELSNMKAVGEAGERIYREKFKSEFEEKYFGQFASINVNAGTAAVDKDQLKSAYKALAEDPTAVLYTLRIGFLGVGRLPIYAPPVADSDRLVR